MDEQGLVRSTLSTTDRFGLVPKFYRGENLVTLTFYAPERLLFWVYAKTVFKRRPTQSSAIAGAMLSTPRLSISFRMRHPIYPVRFLSAGL
jgi:hypothetical protein